MPHVRRDNAAGLFHVYVHCVWAARRLYRDDTDRLSFLRRLARTTELVGWTCISYCLMGSHYHLILAVGDDVLSRGMHALNLGYARDFNRRHGLRGHVQFRRFGAGRIDSESDLLRRFKYVALNPVEAELCEHPQDWAWSSYAGTVGLRDPDSFVDAELVLAAFGGGLDIARRRVRRFVEEP